MLSALWVYSMQFLQIELESFSFTIELSNTDNVSKTLFVLISGKNSYICFRYASKIDSYN